MALLHSRADISYLLTKYSHVPVARTFPLNFDTSLSVFIKLNANCLLESAESGVSMGRYSFIAKGIARKFVCTTSSQPSPLVHSVEDYRMDKYENLVPHHIHSCKNPLSYIRQEMAEYNVPVDEIYSFPPFWGGLIGYLGYETIGYFERIERLYDKPRIEVPDSILCVPQQVVILDHLTRVLWIVETITDLQEYEQADARIIASWEKLQQPLSPEVYKAHKYLLTNEIEKESMSTHHSTQWKSNISKTDFMAQVEYCKECIYRGDTIQVVFSRQIHTSFEQNKELLLYMQLRNVNPSPYMYYLRFDDFSIVGSSPEKMVSLDLDRKVQVKPIAGTIRRGTSREEDNKLQESLLQDEKERAEHIMLVDLGRNDIHRIADSQSVKVPQYMKIEGYSHVYHIVSSVEGTLREGLNAFDCIEATFPAGTLSGAPKIEAMNIIGRTEANARTIYGGMVLLMGFNDYLNSCIIIRTALIKDNTIYLQAGAGIVADSVPEREWQETELKLGALVKAVEMALTWDDDSPSDSPHKTKTQESLDD